MNTRNSNPHENQKHVWMELRRAQNAARIIAADRILVNLSVSDWIYPKIKYNGEIFGILDWSTKSICKKLTQVKAPQVNLNSGRIFCRFTNSIKNGQFLVHFLLFFSLFWPSRVLSLSIFFISQSSLLIDFSHSLDSSFVYLIRVCAHIPMSVSECECASVCGFVYLEWWYIGASVNLSNFTIWCV